MPAAIELDLRDQLNGVGGLVVGADLFAGPVRATGQGVPSRAVFVLPTGGPAPDHYRGPHEVRLRSVQVRIRSEPAKYASGLWLSRAVLDALHRHPPAGYIEVEATSSEPMYLGESENGEHEWSINFLCTIDE